MLWFFHAQISSNAMHLKSSLFLYVFTETQKIPPKYPQVTTARDFGLEFSI